MNPKYTKNKNAPISKHINHNSILLIQKLIKLCPQLTNINFSIFSSDIPISSAENNNKM